MEQQTQKAFTEYDQEGDKVLNLGKLTILQQQDLQKAKAKHRDNMIKPQKLKGKQLKTPGFISHPPLIQFENFDVGRTHVQVVSFTNVAPSSNAFNVLPLPQKIRNYFEIQYAPKGMISPGISTEIKFKFIPQLNEDIKSQFSIMAQTGKISFPILCTSKKTIVRCKDNTVNFGKIIYGQHGTARLYLKNQGALSSDMIFQTLKGLQINKCQDEQTKNLINQLNIQKMYTINGNSQKIIQFTLKPTEIGAFHLDLQLYIKNFIHSPAINIYFVGTCIEVPVKIEKPLYDFQICLLNHIYRQKLIFYNSSELSMSFKMVQPNETKKFFEFNPTMGYIQKNASIEVWVKFSAQKDLPIHLNKFLQQQNAYKVQFCMIVKEQMLPVSFDLKFKITSQKVIIKPSELNFGTIFEGLSSKLQVTFENQSQLPQQILFYPLKKQIFVQNDQPLLKILPKQTAKTFLIYRSKQLQDSGKPIKQQGSIPVKIITGDIATNQVKLDYCCQTIRPDLYIHKNKIDLPALQIQQMCKISTTIKNNANKQVIFQIFVPHFEVCGLKITPVVKVLHPNQQIEINIQYYSAVRKLGPTTLRDLQQKQKKEQIKEQQPKNQSPPDTKTKKDAKKETKLTKQQQQQLEAEQKARQQAQRLKKQQEQRQKLQLERNFDVDKQLAKIGGKLYDFQDVQHYKWLLPIYFKQKEYPDASAQVNFIQITTTSTSKTLIIDKTQIDYGEVAVGARQVRQLKVTNNGEKSQLRKKQLPVFCCFNVLNSMKEVQKNGDFKAVVQFQPIQEQKFKQRLTFFTQKYTVSCLLKGKGVRPQVKIQPQSGLLNLGSVLLDEYAQKSFKIKNVCNFQVNFTIKRIGQGVLNSNCSRAITYIPTNGVIEPNNSIQIKVRFKPDRINQKFFQKIKIHVPQQKQQKYLFIQGSCYPRQAYVVDFKEQKMPDNKQVLKKIQYPFDSLKLKDQNLIYGPNNKKILLEFQRIVQGAIQKQECTKRKITIGSCKLLDNKMQKPTNFQIIMPKDDRFVCDNMKGVTAPGQQTIVTFTYKPQKADSFIANIPILGGIGQWKDIKCQLKLSGGFIKAGAVDAMSFDIILRAYVNQL